jgi:hypothetical protein
MNESFLINFHASSSPFLSHSIKRIIVHHNEVNWNKADECKILFKNELQGGRSKMGQ